MWFIQNGVRCVRYLYLKYFGRIVQLVATTGWSPAHPTMNGKSVWRWFHNWSYSYFIYFVSWYYQVILKWWRICELSYLCMLNYFAIVCSGDLYWHLRSLRLFSFWEVVRLIRLLTKALSHVITDTYSMVCICLWIQLECDVAWCCRFNWWSIMYKILIVIFVYINSFYDWRILLAPVTCIVVTNILNCRIDRLWISSLPWPNHCLIW